MSDINTGSPGDCYVTLPSGKRVLAITGLAGSFGASNIGAMIIEPVENNQVFLGNVFTTRQIVSLPAGISSIVFDPTLATDKFVVVLPPKFTSIGGDQIEITLYIGSTYTLGTEKAAANRCQNSLNTASVKVFEFPTVTAPGIKAPIQWLLPATATGVNTVGGEAGSELPFDINPALVQRLEINNKDLSAQTFEYNLTWFEIPRDT